MSVEYELGAPGLRPCDVRPWVRLTRAAELDSIQCQNERTELEPLAPPQRVRGFLRDGRHQLAIDDGEQMVHVRDARQDDALAIERDERDSGESMKGRFEVQVDGIDRCVRKSVWASPRVVNNEPVGVEIDTATVAEQVCAHRLQACSHMR